MRLEIVEHQKIKIGNTTNLEKYQISRKDSDYLKGIEDKQKKQIFKWGRNYLTPQQWVGIISTPSITIEILPKIAEDSNKDLLKDTLIRMLKIANDIPFRKNIEANISYGSQGFIDVLASIFLRELESQINSGLINSYKKVKRNLNAVKGSIDFTNNINKNSILLNKFFCKYSLLTEDNKINQTIKYTLYILNKLVRQSKNKTLINKYYPYFDKVTFKSVSVEDIERIIFDRTSIRYKEVLNYCKLFISGNSLDMSSGKVKVDFMLFDMNKLFEKFIFKMYKKQYKHISYQYSKQHLLNSVDGNNKRLSLKPDIILNLGDEGVIIDTKWKQLNGFAEETDVYQLNSYLSTFPNISKGILLYPKTINNDKMVGEYKFINQDISLRLRVATIDLTKLGNKQAFFHSLRSIVE